LLLRRPGCTDNFLNFFLSGLQKLEQRVKKCIELRGEYVESIPSLVAVACFLPGRAKDLSAPLVRLIAGMTLTRETPHCWHCHLVTATVTWIATKMSTLLDEMVS
jgi:hypothetical protein